MTELHAEMKFSLEQWDRIVERMKRHESITIDFPDGSVVKLECDLV